MRIAIFSDIHDHVWNLRRALDWIGDEDNGVEALLICGDLCSPFVLVDIQMHYLKPIYAVFGNNDGDAFRITRNAGRHVTLLGELGELVYRDGELVVRGQAAEGAGGVRIAFNHYPHIGDALARSGLYDIVCYGHDHRRRVAWFDPAQQRYADAPIGEPRRGTLLINPGTLMGYDPAAERGARDVPATFAVLDLEKMEAVVREIGPALV